MLCTCINTSMVCFFFQERLPKPIRKSHPPNANYKVSADYKYECPKCQTKFATVKHQKAHVWACYYCDRCDKHVDYRHAAICGKRDRKGKRLLCTYCNRFRARDAFKRHMTTHGVFGWTRRAHPEVLSEVNKLLFLVRVRATTLGLH